MYGEHIESDCNTCSESRVIETNGFELELLASVYILGGRIGALRNVKEVWV